uniref:Uncharacterized protein n=1 Tax=Melopsittacus undulatus TaxID=13146 RepID=A0A8C6IS24_MELUD
INKASSVVFVILGFSYRSDVKVIFFIQFLCIYIFTVLGNLMIPTIIKVDPIFCTSVTLPRVLVSLFSTDASITFAGCAAQMYFFLLFGATECCMHAAGCLFMDMWQPCGPWPTFIFSLPFCGSNVINHFFCEIQLALMLLCGDTYWNELQIILAATFTILMPFLLVLVSYGLIISSILKTGSAKERYRVFSTCFSHLTVVILFYGTAVFIYIRPKSSCYLDGDKVLSLLFCGDTYIESYYLQP